MEWTDIVIRLLLAFVIGGVIGQDRENNRRPAGLRTHMLVCVGATVTSMVQLCTMEYAINLISTNPELSQVLKVDLCRLGAQVITGVGFLGAGTIIHEKGLVKGLTTAASIWAVACIGLGVGMGFYVLSIVSTIAVYFVLVFFKKAENKYADGKKMKIYLEYEDKYEATKVFYEILKEENIKICGMECSVKEESNKKIESCTYYMMIPISVDILELLDNIILTQKFIQVKFI
ncbi:MgtC/SapB family protein [Clostridium senegalense]|uniref:MgtC/SapB family protein n=1 Tax=Clostridium senegalense TaxID=1465809 RepID=UPI001C11C653|nr:MgtC/SapB family protein [Clostridium senegalense]MBU5227653.1 MgtC/SapB family protein [Clostridium senegalense]